MKSSISLLTSMLAAALIACLVTVIAVFGTLLFLGLGSLLAWLSPLTLFQAICVVIGSTIAVGVVACIVTVSGARRKNSEYTDDYDTDWDFETDEDDYDFPEINEPEEPDHTPKVGRNAPCICGSGKKYKNCCGR